MQSTTILRHSKGQEFKANPIITIIISIRVVESSRFKANY